MPKITWPELPPDAMWITHGKYVIAVSTVRGGPAAIIVSWFAKRIDDRPIGFGELTFYFREGKLCCETEAMGREFAEAVLKALLASAKIVE